MSVQRIVESPRVTKPYTDDAVGRRSSRAGGAVDADLAAGDVRLTMGGEPTFVSVDRSRRRRVEHRRARSDQARPRDGPAAAAEAALRRATASCTSDRASGIPASSCRAGRSAATGAPTASRRGPTPALFADERTRTATAPPTPSASSPRWPAQLGVTAEPRAGRATRTSGTTSGASGGCRSTSIRSTPASTTSWSATACAGSSRRGWTRSSATRCRFGGSADATGTGDRPVVPARRAAVSGARRLADGTPAAARFAAVGGAGGSPGVRRARSLRAARAAARRPVRPRDSASRRSHAAVPACRDPAAISRRRRRRPTPVDRRRRAAPPARGESAAGVVRSALCVEPRGGVLYVFMPPVETRRGLPRSGRRRRSDGARARHARAARGLSAAERSAAAAFPRHARSRRDRGERPAGRATGISSSSRRRRSTRTRGRSASRPRSSCSTAATPAPAAAITSCSAARRRPTARSCGVPTCCAA